MTRHIVGVEAVYIQLLPDPPLKIQLRLITDSTSSDEVAVASGGLSCVLGVINFLIACYSSVQIRRRYR